MISAPVEVRKRGKGEMKMEPERIKEDSMRENGRESEKKPLLNPNYPKVGFLERRRRKKLLNKYYEEQRALLELYEKDDQLIAGNIAPIQNELRVDQILNKLLFILNICLIAANLTAALLSGSLAIISTFIDSTMDLTTSIIIGSCLHFIKDNNTFDYPRGRARLEILGVILCSIMMGVVNIAMVVQSVEAIINNSVSFFSFFIFYIYCRTIMKCCSYYILSTISSDMNWLTLVILISGCSIKAVLMVVCYKRGTSSSKVLAMDMRNDIMTSVTAIVCASVGDKYWPYADPIGAILVCGMISLSWFHHALENIPSMIGIRGDRENLSRVLRLSINHDERITKIDHVCLFHIGSTAIVELHVVMNEELPLKITHDISHPLEKKLNKLDFVERTYIHCDYACDGD